MLSAKAADSEPSRCGLRQAVVASLSERFQERRAAFGLAQGGELVEVFVGPSGTWTILVSYPGGPTCILGAGESWQGIDGTPAKPKEEPVA